MVVFLFVCFVGERRHRARALLQKRNPRRRLSPSPLFNIQNSVKTPGVEACEMCECAPCQCDKYGSQRVPFELTKMETKRRGGPHLHSKAKEVCSWCLSVDVCCLLLCCCVLCKRVFSTPQQHTKSPSHKKKTKQR